MVALSLPSALAVGVFLGLVISDRPRWVAFALAVANILMTVPSLALFSIMVAVLSPFKLGLGVVPAIVAITVYSLLPILRNTVLALQQVPPRTLEAARGLGYTPVQVLLVIRLPLSIPVIMAGVRNAIVLGVGVAAYASLVGAGGLGYFIFAGVSRANFLMVATGALLVSVLGVGLNAFLLMLERWLTPQGIRVSKKENHR